MIGAYIILLPTEPLYCLQEGDYWVNERPFFRDQVVNLPLVSHKKIRTYF
jgi:hypothetical protein